MFNCKRLQIARQRRRLSAKALAELASLSHVTITRLENGQHVPTPETISMLSKVLKFPAQFFHGDDIDELPVESVSFRSLSSMTSKEKSAALSAGSLACLLSDWISNQFKLPEVNILNLSAENDPEKSAIELRQHWGLGEQPISHMIKLLESKGIRVFSLAENTKNVDAFSCWRNSIPYVFLNTYKSAEHSRFDAAHELGHLVMHKHAGPQQDSKRAELDANIFASSFLMPSADVKSIIPYVYSINDLLRVKKRWGVSVAALATRLKKLNILSEARYRAINIQISKAGFRTSEPDGIQPEYSEVWQKVLNQLWKEKVSKNKIAEDLNIPLDELENLIFGLAGSYRVSDSFNSDISPRKMMIISNKE